MLSLRPGTARAAHAGDGERRIGKQTGLQQRNERQQDARGIAARAGDEPCCLDLIRTHLRKRVNSLVEQLGSRVRMAVKLLIQRGAAQTEVGAEVNDLQAEFEQRFRILRGHTMRHGEEGDFGSRSFERIRIRSREGE
jgi:hypothetical protein